MKFKDLINEKMVSDNIVFVPVVKNEIDDSIKGLAKVGIKSKKVRSGIEIEIPDMTAKKKIRSYLIRKLFVDKNELEDSYPELSLKG